MNCKHCKHFDPFNESELRYDSDGLNDNVGYCKKSEHVNTYDTIRNIKTTNAMVSASEWGDDSTVLVGVDFGCIHFESK